MLDDQSILHRENVAGSEAQFAPRRRRAEIDALMRADIDEARRDLVFARHDRLDLDVQIRQSFQPSREEPDGRLFRLGSRRGRRGGGARLVVHIIFGK